MSSDPTPQRRENSKKVLMQMFIALELMKSDAVDENKATQLAEKVEGTLFTSGGDYKDSVRAFLSKTMKGINKEYTIRHARLRQSLPLVQKARGMMEEAGTREKEVERLKQVCTTLERVEPPQPREMKHIQKMYADIKVATKVSELVTGWEMKKGRNMIESPGF